MLNNLLLGQTAEEKLYVEDVFSTWLYTDNGSTNTITNGIDLSGKGGLVWAKPRSAAYSHEIYDTARGNYRLSSDSSSAQTNMTGSGYGIGFTSTGFTIGSANTNTTYVSWTFRKAPKFFDVVTWTGNGTSGRTINHSLGTTPGMIIWKVTNVTEYWGVWHRSLAADYYLYMNTTGAQVGTFTNIVTGVSSATITLGNNTFINGVGTTVVAYLFAHDTTADGIVQCGSYTGNGSASGPSINLGWEPQFVLVKRVDNSGYWVMHDTMRGMSYANDLFLFANASDAETNASAPVIVPNTTGFSLAVNGTSWNASGSTYIYLAIRRGPMRTPTDATKVFKPLTRTGTGAAATITGVGFAPDMAMINVRDSTGTRGWVDKLRGPKQNLFPAYTDAEKTSLSTKDVNSFNMDGISFAGGSDAFSSNSTFTYINYFLKRAPGFFDVTCYSGVGSHQNITHQLGVAPELVIIKRRDSSGDWWSYAKTGGFAFVSNSAAQQFALNTTNGAYKSSDASDLNLVTTTTFSTQCGFFGSGYTDISGAKYVAYLFASCPGVSKVGSYSGNGSSQSIDCGFTNGARFVLIKRTDSTGDWFIHDSAMGITSSNDPTLALNSTTAQINNNGVAPLASGFSVSFDSYVANRNPNVSGATYIYLAIA